MCFCECRSVFSTLRMTNVCCKPILLAQRDPCYVSSNEFLSLFFIFCFFRKRSSYWGLQAGRQTGTAKLAFLKKKQTHTHTHTNTHKNALNLDYEYLHIQYHQKPLFHELTCKKVVLCLHHWCSILENGNTIWVPCVRCIALILKLLFIPTLRFWLIVFISIFLRTVWLIILISAFMDCFAAF